MYPYIMSWTGTFGIRMVIFSKSPLEFLGTPAGYVSASFSYRVRTFFVRVNNDSNGGFSYGVARTLWIPALSMSGWSTFIRLYIKNGRFENRAGGE